MKTYKREVAAVQLALHWASVAGIFVLAILDPEYDLRPLIDLTTGLAIWVYGFAAAAFGLDAFAKQIAPSRQALPTTVSANE